MLEVFGAGRSRAAALGVEQEVICAVKGTWDLSRATPCASRLQSQ